VKISRLLLIVILAGACLFGGTTLTACGSSTSSAAKTGDTVQVNYTLTMADGTVYETSVSGQPLELTLGKGGFLPDFENAIPGMKVGESKTITISAANAYGAYSDNLVFTVNRGQLAPEVDPKIGDQLQSTDSSGQTLVVLVKAVTDTTVTLDANSPLAGKDITFKIDLLKIK
jgi:peptidylprolyl isomerase